MRLLVGEKLMLLDSPSEADRAKLFESEAVREPRSRRDLLNRQ